MQCVLCARFDSPIDGNFGFTEKHFYRFGHVHHPKCADACKEMGMGCFLCNYPLKFSGYVKKVYAEPRVPLQSAPGAPNQSVQSVLPQVTTGVHPQAGADPVQLRSAQPQSQPQPVQSRPVQTQLQPVNSQPQTVNSQPQPVNSQPQPVNSQPQPVKSQLQPVQAQPQPVQTQPQPVKSQPQPVNSQLQPVNSQPQPAEHHPSKLKVQIYSPVHFPMHLRLSFQISRT